ncbi:hypothetical protein chiPu_0001499 [Chiloscyllium punctatum]|uniref:Uncharacterized protein n=1 Tax=Chiloscyllium punctatum TaxID=137246 RepID=A0A401RY75_CHIPU|nr:hypothetical protein [Chiloscyllium punctatum]
MEEGRGRKFRAGSPGLSIGQGNNDNQEVVLNNDKEINEDKGFGEGDIDKDIEGIRTEVDKYQGRSEDIGKVELSNKSLNELLDIIEDKISKSKRVIMSGGDIVMEEIIKKLDIRKENKKEDKKKHKSNK